MGKEELFKTRPVLGTEVAAVTRTEAAEVAIRWGRQKDRAYAIEAADVHVITRARHESEFGEVIGKFDMICPDGMPVKWSLNRQLEDDEKLASRLSGAELMEEVFLQSAHSEVTHFLLGGSEDLLAMLPDKMSALCEGSKVSGVYSPPFGEWPDDELERIISKIEESGAQHIWVGLGCPKQERWIAKHKEELPVGCYYGVGAAFAFHAGMIPRAPQIFQKLGMEWFYRLCREPRRLWKRYFTYNSLFIRYTFFK